MLKFINISFLFLINISNHQRMSHEPATSSCSKISEIELQKPIDYDNFEFYIQNHKAEVELLESVQTGKDDKVELTQGDDGIGKIKFNCYCCGMEEMVHYFGLEPNFVFGIKFSEPTYVIKDPFQPRPPKWKSKPEYFVALGAHCKLCDNMVCKDNECSFFYINSYCISCAKNAANTFPLDVQQKFRKQLDLI